MLPAFHNQFNFYFRASRLLLLRIPVQSDFVSLSRKMDLKSARKCSSNLELLFSYHKSFQLPFPRQNLKLNEHVQSPSPQHHLPKLNGWRCPRQSKHTDPANNTQVGGRDCRFDWGRARPYNGRPVTRRRAYAVPVHSRKSTSRFIEERTLRTRRFRAHRRRDPQPESQENRIQDLASTLPQELHRRNRQEDQRAFGSHEERGGQ